MMVDKLLFYVYLTQCVIEENLQHVIPESMAYEAPLIGHFIILIQFQQRSFISLRPFNNMFFIVTLFVQDRYNF